MPANCSFDDDTTATDNVDFMVGWFEKYPNFKGNDLYLSGESYGGIYIPMLALGIVEYNNKQTDATKKLNLKGMMVGNGCTNWDYDCNPATIEIGYGRAMYSNQLYNTIMDNNCSNNDAEFAATQHLQSEVCAKACDEMETSITHYDFYNMYKYAAIDTNNSCAAESSHKALWRQPYRKQRERK